MKLILPLIFIFISFSYAKSSDTLTIAAASDLSFAMKDLIADFKTTTPNANIELISGSSGKFYHQIMYGAPYDMYFSADVLYPEKLLKSGYAVGEVFLYAIGRIVLWSSKIDVKKSTINSLLNDNIIRISIANPKHAPYGVRAKEFLQSNNLWEKVEPKLIYGENISQATNYAVVGAADIGVIALSLALAPTIAGKGTYWLIPSEQHKPLEQGYAVLKRAENNQLQKAFSHYLKSDKAIKILSKYGFVVPSK